jgi:hypothetical protein
MTQLGTKRCSTCREHKPLDAFNRLTRSPDGRQWNCRACNAEWHADNKERHNALIHRRRQRVRMENQQRLLEYLESHPCVDCGERDPVVLEFDHLRDKRAAVSTLGWASDWPTVEREIEKCEVRCANCHRRVTAARAQSTRWRKTRRQPTG